MTSPASKFLDKWFESEPLKATLATDSVIGAMTSPQLAGSGFVIIVLLKFNTLFSKSRLNRTKYNHAKCYICRYVLLHHVMGELEGVKGAWGYVRGGMGALSEAIASSARAVGADIFTNSVRNSLLTETLSRRT